MLIPPLAPSLAIVELALMKPGSALFTDDTGRGSPSGQTVMKLFLVASSSMVTLRTAAKAAAGGGLPASLNRRLSVSLAPSGLPTGTPIGPDSGRVSSIRSGLIDTNTCASVAGTDSAPTAS